MAGKSTRGKIKAEADKIQVKLETCNIHLKTIDELAGGQSDVISQWLPALVNMFETCSKFVTDFRERL